jgi:formamidopyrimidine-DNA glycosylase
LPELPDVTVYVERLDALVRGQRLLRLRINSPFVVRTVDPPASALEGRRLDAVQRLGKRILMRFGDAYLVVHLMIAGRLHVKKASTKPNKTTLAVFEFESITIHLTEASTKKRASMHVVKGENALAEFDRGGIEPLTATRAEFLAAMARDNHTLKRALTDPTILSGVGNAYSDEILHRARLSPFLQTQKLDEAAWRRLHAATREVLQEWIERTRKEVGEGFPENVTAFRDGMAVHGRFGKPCPVCSTPIQRIVYAENEANYCPTCQTEGRLLADRGLSRLLKSDWPKTLDEMERRNERLRGPPTG